MKSCGTPPHIKDRDHKPEIKREKMNDTEAAQAIGKMIENVEKVFVGKREVVELAVNALFSGGHLLIDDLPGVGKTTLAKALAKSIGGATKRVQFTPDLLPSDITGVNIYVHEKSEFVFHPGPVFTNIFLADEINRATPRSQSCLLEAMEERQISVDGKIYRLGSAFIVVATQNPVEIHGTFPLPEAQLDRFMISLSIGYPSIENEIQIMDRKAKSDPLDSLETVLTIKDVEMVKRAAKEVTVSEVLKRYIVAIITETRKRDDIHIGTSPRASVALMATVRTNALMRGRNYVIPDDIKALAVPTLSHRIILMNSTRIDLERNRNVIRSILDKLPAPRPR